MPRRRQNRDKIVIFKSDTPDWDFEVYDWRGLFIGYLGNKNQHKNIVP